jgi:hypothetical protein
MASRLGRVRVQAPNVYRGSDGFIFFPPGGPTFSQRCSSFHRTLDGVLNRFMAKFVPCFLSASNSARIASMFSFNKDRSIKISSSVHLCCFESSEDIVEKGSTVKLVKLVPMACLAVAKRRMYQYYCTGACHKMCVTTFVAVQRNHREQYNCFVAELSAIRR